MPWRRLLLALVLLAAPARAAEPVLILISLDGFRWDYLQQYAAEAPCLRDLAATGVRAERMISCFPTLTFPNHYTIATGLLPEHHGIVANSFYDPNLQAAFSYRKNASVIESRWWGGEPIWVTAEQQGRRSACLFWPGSEAAIGGQRPTYYKTFDDRLTSDQRVDDLLAWLSLPADRRPVCCTLYLDATDHAGHDDGPDSPQMAAAVREVDTALARLRAGLAARDLPANLVVISDHGMTAVRPDRTVYLDDLIDLQTVHIDNDGVLAALRPIRGTPEELAARLRRRLPPYAHVYLRAEVPARYHYRDNPRIDPVLILPDEGGEITTHAYVASHPKAKHGDHGYDNALISMGATFIAQGPAFRQGLVIPPFPNLDVYNLLCAVLGLHPAPNDGDATLVTETLRAPPAR